MIDWLFVLHVALGCWLYKVTEIIIEGLIYLVEEMEDE